MGLARQPKDGDLGIVHQLAHVVPRNPLLLGQRLGSNLGAFLQGVQRPVGHDLANTLAARLSRVVGLLGGRARLVSRERRGLGGRAHAIGVHGRQGVGKRGRQGVSQRG